MAYKFIRSKEEPLTGDNVVKKGTDCEYKFIVELDDPPGPFQLPTAEWTVRSQFRNVLSRQPGSATTNCPTPTVSILNAGLGGEILLEIPHAQTEPSTILAQGVYSIECVHIATGKVFEAFRGPWSLEDEATA